MSLSTWEIVLIVVGCILLWCCCCGVSCSGTYDCCNVVSCNGTNNDDDISETPAQIVIQPNGTRIVESSGYRHVKQTYASGAKREIIESTGNRAHGAPGKRTPYIEVIQEY
uniref:Secreted protein n=1 Tax=Panagrolaimus davidi TaxID=227884 RepID=A0A914P4X7_9BILA